MNKMLYVWVDPKTETTHILTRKYSTRSQYWSCSCNADPRTCGATDSLWHTFTDTQFATNADQRITRGDGLVMDMKGHAVGQIDMDDYYKSEHDEEQLAKMGYFLTEDGRIVDDDC